MKYIFLFAITVFYYGTITAFVQAQDISPTFDKPYKTIVKTPKGYVEVEYFPPQWETISEQSLISPSCIKWMRGREDRCCSLPEESGRCKVWVIREVPAQYKTVTKKILTKPLTWTETPLWMPNIEQELKPFDFTLSPNPAEAQLHLDTDRHYQAAKLYITNVAGAVVLEQKIAQAESDFWIDVAQLPAGIYAVWFVDEQQHIMKDHDNKFVKQ